MITHAVVVSVVRMITIAVMVIALHVLGNNKDTAQCRSMLIQRYSERGHLLWEDKVDNHFSPDYKEE